MAKQYELNEKDIDSVLRYLKLTDPEHATAEWAIGILEYMHETMDSLSFDNPELLDKIVEDFKNKKTTT